MFSLLDVFPRALAVDAIKPIGTANPNSTGNATGIVSAIGDNLVSFLFLIGGILAVIYLLWAGVQYITAGGSPDKAKAARQSIINAVIGIIIMMAAFFIIRFATTVGRWVSDGATTSSGSSTTGSNTSRTTGTTTNSSGGGTTQGSTTTGSSTQASNVNSSSTTSSTGGLSGNGNSNTQVRP